MRKIAIDTNIYISFKVNDPGVVENFRKFDLIGVDVTVIAELFLGFLWGPRKRRIGRNWRHF